MTQLFLHGGKNALVDTRYGRVRGYVYNGIFAFKGIPYARAKRFHAPEPPKAWEDERDATSYGNTCPLLEMPKPQEELFAPHRYWPMDEDCLNLNIWTPGCDNGKRPVLVWLHGGGFETGSSIEQIAYEGVNMSRRGKVVTVSVNHRLNLLGYFDLSDFGPEYENSGNAGMEDLIAALLWIRDNIAAFGGDPQNVTLFGQSGGGAKITTLLQMPAADGLFHKGIVMSGVFDPVLSDATGSGKEMALALMKETGVSGVKELEEIPFPLLARAYLKLRPAFEKAGKNTGGKPHPNRHYLGDPLLWGFRRESAGVPLLAGSVFGEFQTFGPARYDRKNTSVREGERIVRQARGDAFADRLLPLFAKAYPERNPADLLLLDDAVRPFLKEYVKKRSAISPATWSYLFQQDLPVNGATPPWHCADIPYVFGNTRLVESVQVEGVTDRLEAQIFDSVMAFARTGDPNHPGLPDWPPCTPESEPTLLFDRSPSVRRDYDKELMEILGKSREKTR